MDNKPFVSVLINNYNYSEFLPEAIESVLNQTYRNFELIIVDDGSTDNSADIIERYYKENQDIIKPIYKKNGGQASAMNAGYYMARGEIIAFLDSDDFWFPAKLESIVKYHERYGIVQHNLLVNGKQKYIKLRNDIDWAIMMKEYGCLLGYWIPTTGLTFSHHILEKVFPIPEKSLKLCADAFIFWNALYFSKIYSIDDALGFYRVHGKNNWHNRFNDERIKSTVDEILEELNNKLSSLGYDTAIRYESASYGGILSFFIKKGERYVLYGTGSLSAEFTKIIKEHGGIIVYYSDTNNNKWGGTFEMRNILAPEDLVSQRKFFDKIVVASSFVDEIVPKLEKLGFIKDSDIIVPQL